MTPPYGPPDGARIPRGNRLFATPPDPCNGQVAWRTDGYPCERTVTPRPRGIRVGREQPGEGELGWGRVAAHRRGGTGRERAARAGQVGRGRADRVGGDGRRGRPLLGRHRQRDLPP